MDKKNVFVTGATGFIGRHLIAYLLNENLSVYALTRRKDSDLDRRVKIIASDITERFAIPYGITTIYHCAGVFSQKDQMENVNIRGTQNIVKIALEQNCRLIHLSSAGVVGKVKDNYIDENMSCNPQNLYEQTKLEAEKIVKKGIDKGLKSQILRPTIVFGVGRDPSNDSFLQLVASMKSGRFRTIGDGGIYNIIHVNEVVRAMRSLDNDTVHNGGVYFINAPITFKEMYRIVQEETKGKVNELSHIPYSMALGAAAIFGAISLIFGKKMPLTFSRVKALTNKVIFSQKRLLEMTPYHPLSGSEEYIKQVCREYTEKGLLKSQRFQ